MSQDKKTRVFNNESTSNIPSLGTGKITKTKFGSDSKIKKVTKNNSFKKR